MQRRGTDPAGIPGVFSTGRGFFRRIFPRCFFFGGFFPANFARRFSGHFSLRRIPRRFSGGSPDGFPAEPRRFPGAGSPVLFFRRKTFIAVAFFRKICYSDIERTLSHNPEGHRKIRRTATSRKEVQGMKKCFPCYAGNGLSGAASGRRPRPKVTAGATSAKKRAPGVPTATMAAGATSAGRRSPAKETSPPENRPAYGSRALRAAP